MREAQDISFYQDTNGIPDPKAEEAAEFERRNLVLLVLNDWEDTSTARNATTQAIELRSKIKVALDHARSNHNERYMYALVSEFLSGVGRMTTTDYTVKDELGKFLGEELQNYEQPSLAA